MKLERVLSLSGNLYSILPEPIGQGSMKDVFITRDRTQVIAFYRVHQKDVQGYEALKTRLLQIVEKFRPKLLEGPAASYWEEVFCWPVDVVEHRGRIGFVAPLIPGRFFFEHGSLDGDFLGIQGSEKECKWFVSPKNRFQFLDTRERGNLATYLRGLIQLCRAVRRLHSMGLSHGDLSYRNVLFDAATGKCYLIDLDGLVVPGMLPPEVLGTPDFIAPEVLSTRFLPASDSNRAEPGRFSDLHALAVMIYQFLLMRHPLRGAKIHAEDPLEDESLAMGREALFIESRMDPSNRPVDCDSGNGHYPWCNLAVLPMDVLGSPLVGLFRQAFERGLHRPSARPTAEEWEHALIQTSSLLLPCAGESCPTGWFIYRESHSHCPFCGQNGPDNFLRFISEEASDTNRDAENEPQIVVYEGLNLYPWQLDDAVFPDETLPFTQRKPVADVQILGGKWNLILRGPAFVTDLEDGTRIGQGQMLELRNGQKIKTSLGQGERVFRVTLMTC